MRPFLFIIASVILLVMSAFAQTRNVYEIYAIEFAAMNTRMPVNQAALETKSNDSVDVSYFVWYLKGDNGRKVLVDVGFLEDSTKPRKFLRKYERPDLSLHRVSIDANQLTDVIISHPHWDHIGALNLFSKATVWMQKNDFAYFVGDAWQKNAYNAGLNKQDVPKIVQVNLEGRLQLVNGDSLEIIPGIRAFVGSKHTFESQYLLINTQAEKVLIASDNCWFYYNLDNLLSVPYTFDPQAYIRQLRRMKALVSNIDLIIPGHDALVFSKFKRLSEGVVRIR